MKKKRYQVGNSFYEIPESEVSSFLKDNPKAFEVRFYDIKGSQYNIPVEEADAFETDMGLKKKDSGIPSKAGGKAGTSEALSGFEGLKPAKIQPIEIKEPKVSGEDTALARRIQRQQQQAIASTEVKLPAAPKVVAEEKAAARAAEPKLPEATKQVGEFEAFSNALERGFKQGQIADMMALGQMPSREDLKEIARLTREQQALPASEAFQKFNSAPDISTAAKEFIKNPFEISSQLIGESLSALIRHGSTRAAAGAGMGAALGSVIPGAGTAAGAGLGYIAGSGVAGYNLEVASSILDSFKEAGVDVSDEKSLQKGFDDPKILRKAREFANKRAIPIALFDMFSAGMGGKLLGKPAKTMLQKVGRGAAEVGVQVGLAGAGEATAQKVSGQKFNPTAVFAEMIGEAGGGAPDILVGTAIENKKQGKPTIQEVAKLDVKPEELQDMLDVSEATGEITDAQADEIKNEYAKVQEVRSVVPEQYKKNAEVIEAIQKKRELELQKKGLDPVFAKKIDAQIAEQDARIEQATEAVPETEKTSIETLNNYLSNFKRQLSQRKKELGEQGITDIEADEQVQSIERKIKNTQDRISKAGEVAPSPVIEEITKVEPIRQLGTGSNVYFENERYRVNDYKGKTLLNVQGTGDTGVITNLKFDTPEEAVSVAKTLNSLYPQGVPEAVLLDKVVENIKAGKYKEQIVGEEAPPQAPTAPAEEELPFGETAPREVKETKQETNLKKRALNLEIIDNPRGEVLQYFISGGKISPRALEELFGKERRMGMGKIRVEERRSRTALTNSSAPSIEELAEKIAGVDRTERMQDYRDAIEEALLNHSGTATMAEELVNDYDIDFAEQKRMAELEDMGRDIEIETQNFLSQVPEAQKEEMLRVLDRFRDEQGFVDWRAIDEELKGGFEPVLLELSEESQKIIENAINQIKEGGRVSGVPAEAVTSAEEVRGPEETLKPEEYAIQEQAAGEVPVQPETGVSEEVEGGVPPTEPPKPPQEGEDQGAAEKKSVGLSLKGINDVANEFSIEQVEGRPRKTDVELREEAKAQIDKWAVEGSYDKNIEGLIKKAEDSEVLTDRDRVILEQHLANLRQEFKDGIDNGTIVPDSPEFDEKLKGLKKLIDAAAKTRSAAGAALRIPIGGSVAHPLENYDTALVAKMEANGVDMLTPEQKMEVEESVKLYKQKLDDANAKIKDLEEKMSQMMAEEEVGIAKKKRQVKSKEARIQERKNAVAAAREALKKLRSGQEGLSAVPLPYVREFVAIAPHVKKVMESYVGEGIDNLTVLIDKIYEDFKDVVPEITRKDVRDIIGGDYSPKKETLNQQKRIISDLKQEAKLLGEYEKLLAGEEPRLPRQKVEKNRKIKELREKINEIRRRNREADVDYIDLKKINDTKNRALQRAEEYRQKIENKDFAPSEESVSIFNDLRLQRKYPKEYGEMLDAVKEKEDAKHEFDIALLRDEQDKETGLQKTGRILKNIVGTTKAIKSGIDDSGVLIQNFAAVLAYPASGLKTFLNHWQDFASEKKFNRWHTQLKNNKPVWDLIERSGLSVTEPAALKEAQKEEIFSNNLLDRTFKVAGKSYNIGKYTTKPFERLFVSMGNGLRVDVFLKIAQKWYEEGKTFETHPEDFKSLATMLNSMTGRGKLAPAVQRASDIIGGGIWSPQLMASRLNLLGISDVASPLTGRKGYYKGLSPEVRNMQIRNMAQMIGTGIALMGLASLAGGESDLDPESPTFGTIQIGNKRIPVFSNFSKYVKAVVQLATGKQKIEKERVEKNRMQTVTKFFRSGVPPATGAVIDVLTGTDYAGQPVTTKGLIRSAIAPMSLDAIAKELKRDGALGAVTGLGQFFGLNISDERDYVKREDRPFKVKDPKTFKERETTPAETERYIKLRDKAYERIVKENEGEVVYIDSKGDVRRSRPSTVSDEEFDLLWREKTVKELNKEQAKQYYKLLMSKAKKEAKKDLQLDYGEEEKEE